MASALNSEDIVAKHSSRPRAKRGGLWFRIHSLIGLNLSLLLAFVFLTGTLSVFASEIDWLLKPQIRASAAVPADDLPWEAMAQALAERAPDSAIDIIAAGPSPIFAPAAYIARPDAGLRILYFDSGTGAVQGEGTMISAKSLLRGIHSRLLLPEQPGIALVSALSIFLTIALAAAMLFSRKWWRGFFKVPRRDRGRRVFWGDLHRLAGLWSLVFGIVVAFGGFWYFAEELAVPAPLFEGIATGSGKMGNAAAAALLPQALDSARAAYPELHIRRIIWPGAHGTGFGFYGQDGTLLVRPRANGIAVDALDRTILGRHSGRDASLHQRIAEAADPLHMGYFAGYWSKALWFVSGMLMILLAISGALVCVRRLATGGATADTRAAGRLAWFRPFRGLGFGLLLSLIALGNVLVQLPGTLALLR